MDYAESVNAKLKKNGIRSSVDMRAEKIGYKIKRFQNEQGAVYGNYRLKEEEEKKISVRSRYLGDEGQKDLDTFIDEITKEIREKTIREIEVEE